jgi:predicted peroxiredoxin
MQLRNQDRAPCRDGTERSDQDYPADFTGHVLSVGPHGRGSDQAREREPDARSGIRRRASPGYGLSMTYRSLVVKATSGKEDPERCNQALTVAATAVASGLEVSLWLTGDAAWLALPGGAAGMTLPHAVPVAELLEKVLGNGTVTVCTQCAARRGITADDLVDGARIAGAATFVAEIMTDGAQAVVY